MEWQHVPVLYLKYRQRRDPVVYMWITNSDFKACQNSFMIRVMVCWPWGKTQSRVLKLFRLQNRPWGMLFGKKLQPQRCISSFFIPIKDGSIFLLSFIRHRLKSSHHHRSFFNAEPSQPWGAERAISCLIWSETHTAVTELDVWNQHNASGL